MRVTGGDARGHTLLVPQTISDLRPSQDQVREAIFNILGPFTKGTDVLDLYAGTGALGIEALSRGARTCDFVDSSKDAITAIQTNLKHSRLEGKSDLFCDKASNFLLRSHHQRYDLIFLDPPYVETPRDVILSIPRFLKEGGILVYLHAKRVILTEQADRRWIGERLKVVEDRRYGKTHVTFLTLRDISKSKLDS